MQVVRILLITVAMTMTSIQVVAQTLVTDTDGDGLIDTEEDANGNDIVDNGETNPMKADSDNGGEADGAEIRGGRNPLNPNDDLTYDQDNDGITNAREKALGTDPQKQDTDDDGLKDLEELRNRTNPLIPDTDGDGLKDGKEMELGTDPRKQDTDGDGITDDQDPFPLESAFTKDSDHDGIPDEWEESQNLAPQSKTDGSLDTDDDGLTNIQEFIHNTHPHQRDTDGDGIPDGKEVTDGTDPEANECLSYHPTSRLLQDIAGHWSEPYVTPLLHTQAFVTRTPIIEGYTVQENPERVFLPDRPITRFELLKIALMSNCIQPKDIENEREFRDVPLHKRKKENAERAWRRRIVGTALFFAIIEGYPDKTFRPDNTINRAEALKILLQAGNMLNETGEKPETDAINFFDVPPSAWFHSLVQAGTSLGIIEGFPDGTFRPEQPITRAEAAKIIYLTMIGNPRTNGDSILSSRASPSSPEKPE